MPTASTTDWLESLRRLKRFQGKSETSSFGSATEQYRLVETPVSAARTPSEPSGGGFAFDLSATKVAIAEQVPPLYSFLLTISHSIDFSNMSWQRDFITHIAARFRR